MERIRKGSDLPKKKRGVTEHPTEIFAHQVNAKVISSIFCWVFDLESTLENDVARACLMNSVRTRDAQKSLSMMTKNFNCMKFSKQNDSFRSHHLSISHWPTIIYTHMPFVSSEICVCCSAYSRINIEFQILFSTCNFFSTKILGYKPNPQSWWDLTCSQFNLLQKSLGL